MPGSVIDRGNNKWELRISAGYNENKKQRRITKTIYARTKKEAKLRLAEFYLEKTGRLDVEKEITFSEFVEYWQIRYYKRLSEKTISNYNQMLRCRLLPAFGKYKLAKVTDNDVLRFMDQLSGRNMRMDGRHQRMLSSETIMKYFKLLNLIFNKACEWKYLPKNPCKDVPRDMLVPAKSQHYPIWSNKELGKFIRILEEMPDTPSNLKNKLMFYLAVTTGARKGEFLGLTWDCVDLENNSLNINKSLKFINGEKPFLSRPKTEASIRILYFDDYVKTLLIEYKKSIDLWLKSNNMTNPQKLVFVSRNYTERREALPVNGDCFYLWLKRMCDRYDLPRIAVHSLRAMAATNALTSGMRLNMVQAMMGHTNIATTSIYLRDVPDERKEATGTILAQYYENLRK